jgi:hypothetical protein
LVALLDFLLGLLGERVTFTGSKLGLDVVVLSSAGWLTGAGNAETKTPSSDIMSPSGVSEMEDKVEVAVLYTDGEVLSLLPDRDGCGDSVSASLSTATW